MTYTNNKYTWPTKLLRKSYQLLNNVQMHESQM